MQDKKHPRQGVCEQEVAERIQAKRKERFARKVRCTIPTVTVQPIPENSLSNTRAEYLKQKLWKGKIPSPTYKEIVSRGYFPPTMDDETVAEWKSTFVGKFLMKHPKRYSILLNMERWLGHVPTWDDFTKNNTRDMVENFQDSVSLSSAKYYAALVKSIVMDVDDPYSLPAPIKLLNEILTLKDCRPILVYLNEEELKRIADLPIASMKEVIIRAQFLVGCYTGARHSDVLRLRKTNITNGYLSYVCVKTKERATVPCHERLEGYLTYASARVYSDGVFNDTIRDICRREGINDLTMISRGGVEYEDEIWRFITGHTARRSFATNLAIRGCDLFSIGQMMAHADPKQTKR